MKLSQINFSKINIINQFPRVAQLENNQHYTYQKDYQILKSGDVFILKYIFNRYIYSSDTGNFITQETLAEEDI